MVSITHLLNKTVSVKRQQQTRNDQGGYSSVLVDVATGIKGRRQVANYKDRMVAGREEAEVTHVWFFDKGVVVLPRDVLVSGSIQDEVIAELPPSRPDFVKCAVREIQIGATA